MAGHITRHKIDPKRVEESRNLALEYLPRFLKAVRRSPNNLPTVISTGVRLACCAHALDSNSSHVRMGLDVAGAACAALFQACDPTSSHPPITIEGEVLQYDSRPDGSLIYPRQWLEGYFINAIIGDVDRLNSLADIPIDVFKGSSTVSPRYAHAFVSVLQAYWRSQPNVSKLLIEALELTDPERPDILKIDWTLNIDVPLLELLFRLTAGESDFGAAAGRALENHKSYWKSTAKSRNNPEGFASLGISGLCKLAAGQGLTIDVSSDYLIA